MHAQRIIQDLLQTECGAIHAKRRVTLALKVQRILIGNPRPAVIIDWSGLSADRSQHLLRAALVVKGRAVVLYEEVHSMKQMALPRCMNASCGGCGYSCRSIAAPF